MRTCPNRLDWFVRRPSGRIYLTKIDGGSWYSADREFPRWIKSSANSQPLLMVADGCAYNCRLSADIYRIIYR